MIHANQPDHWLYNIAGREVGPIPFNMLEQLARQGSLKIDSPVRRIDWTASVPASSIETLRQILQPSDDGIVTATIVNTPPAISITKVSQPTQAPPPKVTGTVSVRRAVDQPILSELAILPSTKSTQTNASSASTEPLDDPMRDISRLFAKFLWIMFFLLLLLSLFAIIVWIAGQSKPISTLVNSLLYFLWILFFAYWGNLVWWRAFAPRRQTDVLYLRSFQNDPESWPIRVAIQDTLGDRVRLSGIRDPRRRGMSIQDGLSPWLRAMRHCTPKFMDLEAENDWQSRLWNSLQNGSMAVVDLSVVTPFVLDEIRLVVGAIGLERTVFLGSGPQSENQIRELVAKQLDNPAAAENANVLLWPSDVTPMERKSEVRNFHQRFNVLFNRVSKSSPIQRRPTPPEFAAQSGGSVVPMSRRMIKWMFGFQIALIGFQLLLTLLSRVVTSNQSIQVWIVFFGSLPFAVVNTAIFFYNFGVYIRDVGIPRRRIKACILMSMILFSGLPFFLQWYFGRELVTDQRTAISQTEFAEDASLLALEDLQVSSSR